MILEPSNIRYTWVMKIYLARHGRTNYNDLGLCNADPTIDVHLTPIGITQAHTLADNLEKIPFERIFVSELRRTQQTADIVNTLHNVEVEVDARLNDGRSGFEGKDYREFEKALSTATDRWNARFNDGESVEDIKSRVSDFIDELRKKEYDTVLIITSQWIVQAMMAVVKHLSNEEAWALEVEQGAYIEFDI